MSGEKVGEPTDLYGNTGTARRCVWSLRWSVVGGRVEWSGGRCAAAAVGQTGKPRAKRKGELCYCWWLFLLHKSAVETRFIEASLFEL